MELNSLGAVFLHNYMKKKFHIEWSEEKSEFVHNKPCIINESIIMTA